MESGRLEVRNSWRTEGGNLETGRDLIWEVVMGSSGTQL